MVKQKKSIVLMARVLVLALLIGVFASVPSEQTFAAANKALVQKLYSMEIKNLMKRG